MNNHLQQLHLHLLPLQLLLLLTPTCTQAAAEWAVSTVVHKQEGSNFLQLSAGGALEVVYATYGHAIRRVSWSSGTSEIYAGNQTEAGYTDGALRNARFSNPEGLCFISPHTLIVADRGNLVIRSVDIAQGVVTTLAGRYNSAGVADGPGDTARFNNALHGLLCLPDGSVLVADAGAASLRLLKCVGAECPVPTPSGPSPFPAPGPAPSPTNTGWSKHAIILLALSCVAAGAVTATAASAWSSAAGGLLSRRIAAARAAYAPRLTRQSDLHQPFMIESVHNDAETPPANNTALAKEADLQGLERDQPGTT